MLSTAETRTESSERSVIRRQLGLQWTKTVGRRPEHGRTSRRNPAWFYVRDPSFPSPSLRRSRNLPLMPSRSP